MFTRRGVAGQFYTPPSYLQRMRCVILFEIYVSSGSTLWFIPYKVVRNVYVYVCEAGFLEFYLLQTRL